MSERPDVPESNIALEEVAKYPQPGTSHPVKLTFSPDGSLLSYLDSPDGSLTRQLYARAPAGGEPKLLFQPPEGGATEENLSPEEKLRRERTRERGLGVTSYRWAEDADRFLVPVRGDLWVQDGADGTPRKLVDGGDSPVLDPRFSKDGAWIAYVRDAELHVVPAAGGDPKTLTQGAKEAGKTHGLAEYIAQEEMGRHRGFWWSPDASKLAYTEVDESHIEPYRIMHQGRDEPSWEDHGYPFAGGTNAKVRLGVVQRRGGATQWMDLQAALAQQGGDGENLDDFYLARVGWMPSGDLVVQLENRQQTRLDLVRFDPRTGKGAPLLTETTDVWINLHDMFAPLEQGEGDDAGGFVWGSEKTGFRHLYVHDAQGNELRALTDGPWMVDSLEGVDEARGLVYFTGTKDTPTERHLYRVPLAGGAIETLTREPGMHGVELSADFDAYIDQWSTRQHPARIVVRSTENGSVLSELEIPADPRVEALGLEPPELVNLTTRDGVPMHGAIYKPPGDGPFPTIVSVYGGPHAQRVTNSWGMTADMRAQYLRSLGYLVFKVDNRGSARRGLKFEGAIKHDMGNLEVQDQVDGARWLAQQGLADPDRVGIYGWSYGGYMSAMALVRAPETFKVGVAGAPVTHWDGYDTHYTERYMGTPQTNPKGYEDSSVMTHVDALEGDLMLVHGLIDENVHFRHTARLINALIAARKDYELLLFPDERHMPRAEKDRVYMEQRIRDFFWQNL